MSAYVPTAKPAGRELRPEDRKFESATAVLVNAYGAEKLLRSTDSVVNNACKERGNMLEVGARVSRQIEIGKPARKTGTIREKYKSKPSSTSTAYWMYAVEWDDVPNVVTRGYFEHGLERV